MANTAFSCSPCSRWDVLPQPHQELPWKVCMGMAEHWLCFVRGQLHPSGVGEALSPHQGQSQESPSQCLGNAREEGQIPWTWITRYPSVPITHGRDVTWAGGSVPAPSTPQSCCSFFASFGDLSHKSLRGNRESFQQVLLETWEPAWRAGRPRSTGELVSEQISPCSGRVVHCAFIMIQEKPLGVCRVRSTPGTPAKGVHSLGMQMPRDSLQKSRIQIRDFSAAHRGCVMAQTHAQQLGCRGTGRGSPGVAGPVMLGLERVRGRFRFWEGQGVIQRSVFPWQELTSAQMCCVLTAAAPAPRGISPKRCPWAVTAVLPAPDAGDTRPARG